MESAAHALGHAHQLYARADNPPAPNDERPPAFKAIGIGLAVGSGAFIGVSFVLKKFGLLRANEKYNEVAGEGYGYLKNLYWWGGMILMIIGEILNFAAYAFTDAILVTPLGALSVVITAVLSAIFLKERLSMVGKVACFLCIVGSVVIVLNAPHSSSVKNIEEMKGFVIHPAFLTYAGVVIVGSVIVAFWLGPKYGNKNMLVYISICSWVGGLSVVATQGLGAAIIAQANGVPQFNQWFLYVLLVFVIATLLTEIIFLNKALNLFNAALVTPTYYVYFTSTTIISSAILFRGFTGTPSSIVTVVFGFLTICSGVVLLQLSKSAKDVPDAAVFAGDLDQIHTIAEQPQSETEPKADAIRGTAAIVRRLSSIRQKRELDELKRMHEEKIQESLAPVSENGAPQYEWDGIRRRRTGTFSSHRSTTPGNTYTTPGNTFLAPPTPHLPLGWSHQPTEEELAAANRPVSPALSSFVGTIRSRARGVLLPGHPDFKSPDPKVQSPMHPVQLTSIAVPGSNPDSHANHTIPPPTDGGSPRRFRFGSRKTIDTDDSGIPHQPPTPPPHFARRQFSFQNMFRRQQPTSHQPPSNSDGAHDTDPHQHNRQHSRHGIGSRGRGYSIPQIHGVTEEETLGLVKGDSKTLLDRMNSASPPNINNNNARSRPTLNRYGDSDDSDLDDGGGEKLYTGGDGEKYAYRDLKDRDDDDGGGGGGGGGKGGREEEDKQARYGHSITKGYSAAHSPPRAPARSRTPWAGGASGADVSGGGSGGLERAEERGRRENEEVAAGEGGGEGEYESMRRRFEMQQQQQQRQQQQRRQSRQGERSRSGGSSGSGSGSDKPPPPPPPHGGSYGRGPPSGAYI